MSLITFSQLTLEDFFDGKFSIVIPGTKSKLIENTFTPECPVCDQPVQASDFLYDVFIADRDKNNYFAYYMAVFVTHYRHNHQKSWNKVHSNFAYQKFVPGFNYDQEKIRYNNRAKRQLIRAISKSDHYSRDIKVLLIAGTDELQYNDLKTKELMNKTILKLIGAEN